MTYRFGGKEKLLSLGDYLLAACARVDGSTTLGRDIAIFNSGTRHDNHR
ncbi:hypothetical protein ACQEPB_14995 [Novosphingobium fluoreni]